MLIFYFVFLQFITKIITGFKDSESNFSHYLGIEMLSVVFVSFLLLIASSSSNKDGPSVSHNVKVSLDNRETSKDSIKVEPIIDFSNTNDEAHHYLETSIDGMRQIAVRQQNPFINFVGNLNTVLGFGSSVLTIVGFFLPFLGGASKYNIDDVMNKVTTEFSDVKNQLSVVYNKMQKQDIDAYRAVEDAVTAANTDIQLSSTLDLISRGLRLYDQLNVFSKGMLGQNGFSADILQVTSDLLKVSFYY